MNTTEHCKRLRRAANTLVLGLALACSSVAMAQNAPAAAGFSAAGGAPAASGGAGLGAGASAAGGGMPGTAAGAASGGAESAAGAEGFEMSATPAVIGGEGLSPSQDAALDQAVTVDADGNDRVGGTVRAARVLNDFQQFVARSTGQVLPLYGSGFFAGSRVFNSPTAPVADDYVLGPGDQVLVRIWGAFESQTRAQIDRNGMITLPTVGPVSLAGVRIANAVQVIENQVGRIYRDVSVSVSLDRVRGITVFVVGQARRPGTYTVSGNSTLIGALFQSGGPGANGSLRRVQVKRDNQVITEIDLYRFLANGDTSADIRLVDGDVIVIPPAHGYVALTGQVKAPAIYELKDRADTLRSVLTVSGGLPVVADPRLAFVERLDPSADQPRSVFEVSLQAGQPDFQLKSGDVIAVQPILAEFANAVTLRGGVSAPVRLPYRAGMRISDLIPDKATLINRYVVDNQNRSLLDRGSFVGDVGNLFVDINMDYAVVERLERPQMALKLIPFSLNGLFADPNGPDNLRLQAGDTISIFTAGDVRVPVSRRRVVMRVEGEVNRPGVYVAEPGETLVNIIEKAGGPTADAYLFGAEFYRESVRRSQQANLDKLVQRLEQQAVAESARVSANIIGDAQAVAQAQAQLRAEREARGRFLARMRTLKSSGRMSLGLPADEPSFAQIPGFRLENGDRLVIPNRPDFVQVFGAVNTESALLWRPSRTVSDYLEQAGMSREGDRSAAFVLRADGTVVAETGSWFSSVMGTTVLPGDIIVIPELIDRESGWTAFARIAKDWTQIFANLGLGVAAVRSIEND